MKATINKTVHLGRNCEGEVFCKIDFDGDKLSISGVVGPKRNGNCKGSCGQIVGAEITRFAPGWDASKVSQFYADWKAWHLNHMRAGCQHQRALGWDKKPIDPTKPLDTYGKHFPGQHMDSWNMLAWVRQDEHPDGLLMKPCPECGYKYGSAWLKEAVPAEVIDRLKALPETDVTPAWV